MEELVLSRENPVVRFKVEVEGSAAAPKARLFLRLVDKASLCVEGDVLGSVVSVRVPLDLWDWPESADAFLEVEVDGQVFRPWEGRVCFPKKLKVAAAPERNRGDARSVKARVETAETRRGLSRDTDEWERYI